MKEGDMDEQAETPEPVTCSGSVKLPLVRHAQDEEAGDGE
jgi:hypothetical protein